MSNNIKFKGIVLDEKGNIIKGRGILTSHVMLREHKKSKSFLWRKV